MLQCPVCQTTLRLLRLLLTPPVTPMSRQTHNLQTTLQRNTHLTLLNSSTRATQQKDNIRAILKGSIKATLKAQRPATSIAGGIEAITEDIIGAIEDTVAGAEDTIATKAARAAKAVKNTKAKKDITIEVITEDTTGGTTTVRAKARAEKDTEDAATEDTGLGDTDTEDATEDAKATREGTKDMEDMKGMEEIRIGVEVIQVLDKVLVCLVDRVKEAVCLEGQVDHQCSRSKEYANCH
eukprot:TRINITY_DN9818_c0_g1_i4.p2 TRINITY_DN9818_c0_g1~~TRINITY_DN9818_c0_g1_i4.p2  ORF type:complete len:238 (-),score=59.28 TRINITY_DN9818_c0_g1_i4:136-849(-)